MKILALDTATDACTVALRCDGEVLERFELQPRMHSRLVLPMIDSLLDEAGIKLNQIDVIGFGCGPGAFTGVRIAASVTQGIAFAADLPVVAVSTLVTLAQGAYRKYGLRQIIPVIDARMDEVYITQCTLGTNGVMESRSPEIVIPPQEVEMPDTGHWFGVGTGWDRYHNVMLSQQNAAITWNPGRLPQAQDIALIAEVKATQKEVVSAEQAIPVYIRDQVAQRPH